jgi:hypothetical protein
MRASEITKAYRFQRSRKRGTRKPQGGICCDRSSRWGNEFDWRIYGRAQAVAMFEAALMSGQPIGLRKKFTIDDVRANLPGKPLGCYCPLDQPCHVDVLVKIVNG